MYRITQLRLNKTLFIIIAYSIKMLLSFISLKNVVSRLRVLILIYQCDLRFFLLCPQVFGTVELPDKPIMLPPFVEATHCLGYHLTRKGRAVADRVVSVLGYACPDITYSPSLYPITAALLHFMPGECFIIFF